MNMKEVVVTEQDGTRRVFKSEEEVCRFYGLTHSALKRRIRGEVKSETMKFEATGKVNNGEPHNKGVEKAEKKEARIPMRMEVKEKPFNLSGYPEIPYETMGTRLCVTPCPHYKDVLIASVKCQCCNYYHGHSRMRHLVACSHKGV